MKSGIKFDDDSFFESNDMQRILSIAKEFSRLNKAKPVEMVQSGVKIKLSNLEPAKNSKVPDYAKYIEIKYQGWTIRVWRINAEKVYGCNYFNGEDVRYLEGSYDNFDDENGVFRYVQSIIDEI